MSRWDILLDRTNQAKIKTDYVNEVNKENEKKYWKERCDKAQDKFFDMIKAEELKEIFDLYESFRWTTILLGTRAWATSL